VRVVADSHAIFWFMTGSPLLSVAAKDALETAEATDGIVVSVATLIDLWYVTQTTQGVTPEGLERLDQAMKASPVVDLHPLDEAVARKYVTIERKAMRDPWDRFIVATALAVDRALVTRDELIQASGLVHTIW
jgi:PIN domain nuclease of toxin-antitoxin system